MVFWGKTLEPEPTTEQEFKLRAFELQVSKLTEAEAKHLLVELYSQMMIREACYLRMLRSHQGMPPFK